MIESASSEKIRSTNSLRSGLPGVIALEATAGSRLSRRNSAARVDAAGPWQRKQLSDRMGRMSRLKSSFSSATRCPENKRLRKTNAVKIRFGKAGNAISVPVWCAKEVPVKSRFINLFHRVDPFSTVRQKKSAC